MAERRDPSGTEHIAAQSDSIVSISERYGFFADTLWEHPDNAELKKKRGWPYVLLPGDGVVIPELRAIAVRRLDRRGPWSA